METFGQRIYPLALSALLLSGCGGETDESASSQFVAENPGALSFDLTNAYYGAYRVNGGSWQQLEAQPQQLEFDSENDDVDLLIACELEGPAYNYFQLKPTRGLGFVGVLCVNSEGNSDSVSIEEAIIYSGTEGFVIPGAEVVGNISRTVINFTHWGFDFEQIPEIASVFALGRNREEGVYRIYRDDSYPLMAGDNYLDFESEGKVAVAETLTGELDEIFDYTALRYSFLSNDGERSEISLYSYPDNVLVPDLFQRAGEYYNQSWAFPSGDDRRLERNTLNPTVNPGFELPSSPQLAESAFKLSGQQFAVPVLGQIGQFDDAVYEFSYILYNPETPDARYGEALVRHYVHSKRLSEDAQQVMIESIDTTAMPGFVEAMEAAAETNEYIEFVPESIFTREGAGFEIVAYLIDGDFPQAESVLLQVPYAVELPDEPHTEE